MNFISTKERETILFYPIRQDITAKFLRNCIKSEFFSPLAFSTMRNRLKERNSLNKTVTAYRKSLQIVQNLLIFGGSIG